MSVRTVAVVLPNISAQFTVDDVPTGHAGSTDASGYGEVLLSELALTRVTVTAEGYQPYAAEGVIVPMHDNFQFRIGVPRDPDRPQDVILPGLARVAPPLPHLEIRGLNFVDANGQRVSFNGATQFYAFRHFLNGVDLAPLFEESHATGRTMWRVFLQASIAQNTIMDLWPQRESNYYPSLRPFAELLNANGIILLATVFVDNQDIQLGLEHWRRVADCLRGTATMLSGGNEYPKNHFDPGALTDPGMIWSRGSNLGDAMPYSPHASFTEFHPRRDLPAALMDTVASPVYIYQSGFEVPLIIDEPPRMGTDGSGPEYTNPDTCWAFARHYATECGGAVFHNRSGQRGQLMDPQTRACADAWSRGMVL